MNQISPKVQNQLAMLQQVQGTAQSVFVTLNWFEAQRRRRR